MQKLLDYVLENNLCDDFVLTRNSLEQKEFLTYLYKTKRYKDYCVYFEKLNLKDDYILYEYLGIAFDFLLEHEKSLKAYTKAIELNSSLKSAKIKQTFLDHFINNSDIDFKNIISLLNNPKRQQYYIKQLFFIFLNLKKYEDSMNILMLIEDEAFRKLCIKALCEKIGCKTQKSDLFYFDLIKTQSKTLTIIFSSSNNKNVLQNYDLANEPSDRLFIRDLFNLYYTTCYEDIYEKIKSIANDYQKIIIFGVSKSALGAMNVFNLLQKDFKHITINGLILAGFIDLWPINKTLYNTSSYRQLMDFALGYPFIKEKIIKMKNAICQLQVAPKNKLTWLYGNKSLCDIPQAEFLKNQKTNINVVGFDYSAHSILIPLSIPPGKDRAYLEQKYATIKLEDDLIGVDGSLLNYVDEIEAIYKSGVTLRDFV